jgi:hypothetical protein
MGLETQRTRAVRRYIGGYCTSKKGDAMNRIALSGITLLAVAFAGIASAQPTNFTGQWKGECNRCAATSFALVLSQTDKDVTGTIKTEGTPTFGDSVKPILNVRVPGSKLLFEAKADAGDLFYVELSASSDGKTLNGTGWYRNSSFGLWFSRVAQ